MFFSILYWKESISHFRSPTKVQKCSPFLSSPPVSWLTSSANPISICWTLPHRANFRWSSRTIWCEDDKSLRWIIMSDTRFTIWQTTHNGGLNFAFQNFCSLLGAQVTSLCSLLMRSSIDLSGLLAAIVISSWGRIRCNSLESKWKSKLPDIQVPRRLAVEEPEAFRTVMMD